MPRRSQAPTTAEATGKAVLVQHDGDAGIAGELVADGADAATGRIAQPPRVRGCRQQRLDEAGERCRVGPDVGFQCQITAGKHHCHAVVTDRARHDHLVAGAHEFGTERPSQSGSRRVPPS